MEPTLYTACSNTRNRVSIPILLAAALFASTTASAQPMAERIPMQGFLTDSDGVPIDAPVTLGIAVYDVDVGGEPLFTEAQTIVVSSGYFTVYMGDVEALPMGLFQTGETLYVGLRIGDDTELGPRFRLGNVPYASGARYAVEAGDSVTVGGMGPEDFAPALHDHGWSEITSIPADIADGDDDTRYTAGTGLTLAGGAFSFDPLVVQSRVLGTCQPGEYIRGIDGTGGVLCEPDFDSGGDITGVTTGDGLIGGGATGDVVLSADTTYLQRRVSFACLAGTSIRSIADDGTVICEPDDDSGGDITSVAVGAGLTGGSVSGDVTLGVDPTYVQRRISGSCGPGNSIRAIADDGAVICEPDSDSGGDITGVTAGTGMSGGGTTGAVTINANTSYLQRRVSNTCAAGSSIRAIGSDGAVICEPDNNSGGDITGVTAGTGLTGGGGSGAVTINANTSYLQRRVSDSCTFNSFIRSINSDGTVICGAPICSTGPIPATADGLTNAGSLTPDIDHAAPPCPLAMPAIARLEAQNRALEEENTALEDRLARLERALGLAPDER